jgi:nitrogen fixation/metabolism regulation signal transduction histidine kinase
MFLTVTETGLGEIGDMLKIFCRATDSDYLLLNREGVIQNVIFCNTNKTSSVPGIHAGTNISSLFPEETLLKIKRGYSEKNVNPVIFRFDYEGEECACKITLQHYSEEQDILIICNISADEKYYISEKLAAIGRMSAYLSHEIKTPLASIKMNVDMLFRSLNIPEDKQKSASIILKEIKRLDKFLKEIVLYSTKPEVFITEINLHQLADNIKNYFENQIAEKDVEIRNLTDELVIKGDYQKIKLVIQNLVENSIDAIDREGYVEISSFYSTDSQSTSVIVKDNGCGIVDRDSVFEPFYSTKNAATGLGLPIARKLMELHGGSLRLIPSKENVTIFEIIFNTMDKLYG